MFKEIIKGRSAYFCDVCKEEVDDHKDLSITTFQTFWKDHVFHLCEKHGKQVKQYINELKNDLGG